MNKMIQEALVPLSKARELFPQAPSPATLERWVRIGAHGVKLEIIRIGKNRYTSEEAVHRFIDAQNPQVEYPEPEIPRLNEAEILREKKALGI